MVWDLTVPKLFGDRPPHLLSPPTLTQTYHHLTFPGNKKLLGLLTLTEIFKNSTFASRGAIATPNYK